MSIPLDRLYHYIESIAREIREDNVVIYRFFPHGSKKQEDLRLSRQRTKEDEITLPQIICYDQEPLDFERYESGPDALPEELLIEVAETQPTRSSELYKIYSQMKFDRHNLRYYPYNIYDHAILLHSEQRSKNVDKYCVNGFIPVYYWFHALISLDWFRYAKHIDQIKNFKKTFLIYNRAWSGTREYRLKFADLMLRLGLENNCLMNISSVEPELKIHYDLHKFDNPVWRPHHVLEDYFSLNTAQSDYSADFDINDYNSTDIEVVLETLFDDQRLHLTEKALRPIACGQPFILAGTHGSLEYLRSYGFKTFGHVWDERYDMIEDPQERLYAIADLMKQITTWLPHQRENNMAQARAIAEYNKRHFFSVEFQTRIESELKNNLSTALSDIESKNTGKVFFGRRKQILASTEFRKYSIKHKHNNQNQRQQFARLMKLVRKYKLRRL